MSLVVVTSDRFADHLTPPGHPESVERAEVMQAIASRWRRHGGLVLEPRPATPDELVRVHSPGYLEVIAETAGRAVALDADTFTSPQSYEVALLAAGSAVVAVDHVMSAPESGDAGFRAAFALVRPPGHHAERDRAMGFCLYNNIAVAATHARLLGASRIAIVDYDVHHGNGTQWMFYENPHVLYLSTHQYPYYPGTGAAHEIGRGDGEGFTLNVPLEAGATDDDYDLVFTSLVIPVLERFDPELLLVSAGFDAHERDPLAGMRMTTRGFAALNRHLRRLAERSGRGRMVLVTEGGYDLKALAACLDATLEVLAEPAEAPAPDPPAGPAADAASTRRARAALEAVRASQKAYWPGL